MWRVLRLLRRQSRGCLDPPSIMLRWIFYCFWIFGLFKLYISSLPSSFPLCFRSRVKKARRVRKTWSELLPSQAFPFRAIILTMIRMSPPTHYIMSISAIRKRDRKSLLSSCFDEMFLRAALFKAQPFTVNIAEIKSHSRCRSDRLHALSFSKMSFCSETSRSLNDFN